MRIFALALAILVGIAGLRFVPGIRLPPHQMWDFYNLPAIAQGMPWNFTERQTYIGEKVREAFGPGTDRDALIAALRGQGFEVDEGSNEGRYGWIGFGCLCLVMIEWGRDGAKAHFWPFALPDSKRPHPF